MKREIRSHIGLRGIAALMVVAYHQQFGVEYRLPIETASEVFRRSYLMVDLFFVLSGFIISYVYEAERRMSVDDIRAFFRARFARIYPLHVFALMSLTAFALGSSALLEMTGHKQPDLGSFGDWFRQLILLNAWVPARTEWNVPSWSISAEAFAYLLFPFAVAAYVASSRPTQAIIIVGALSFYALIGRSLDVTVGLAPVRCIAGFGLGMLLFFHRHKCRQLPWLSPLQITAAIWILLALIFPIPDPLIIPPFAALVFLTWEDRGLVAKILSTRPLHWLGDISYSVYLMHVPIGTVVWFVWLRVAPYLGLGDAISRVLLLCLVFASVLGVSTLTYTYVEKPCQRALRRRRPQAEKDFATVPSAP